MMVMSVIMNELMLHLHRTCNGVIEHTNGPHHSACFAAHTRGEVGGVADDHGSFGNLVARLNTPGHT